MRNTRQHAAARLDQVGSPAGAMAVGQIAQVGQAPEEAPLGGADFPQGQLGRVEGRFGQARRVHRMQGLNERFQVVPLILGTRELTASTERERFSRIVS